ncbi:MAG: hypothetical protein HYX78_07970 [Armatimonadetes bacterium]|nr:hypothetical protein [Armatimonadota bacterium]
MPMSLLGNLAGSMRSAFTRQSNEPVGLCTLVSLATMRAHLDVLNMQTSQNLFAAADEDSFTKAQQFIALYTGMLVRIYTVDMVESRKMKLSGTSWDEFDAETEIDSGIADALNSAKEGAAVPEGDEFSVTSDMYLAYMKDFLRHCIAAYENAISEAERGDHRLVDQYAIAADQFIQNITSIAAYGKTVPSSSYHLASVSLDKFAKKCKLHVERICSKTIRDRTITSHLGLKG